MYGGYFEIGATKCCLHWGRGGAGYLRRTDLDDHFMLSPVAVTPLVVLVVIEVAVCKQLSILMLPYLDRLMSG